MNTEFMNRLVEAVLGEPLPGDGPHLPPDVAHIQYCLDMLASRGFRTVKVLEARLGAKGPPMTLKETGALIQRSGERARQIEAKALRYLRHPRCGFLRYRNLPQKQAP